MDLRQLECFVAVAEELHFRRAGERLGISQSALSERISALEHEIGVPLFFRTTRQVSLTQAGADFFTDAVRILEDVDKSVSKVQHAAKSGLSRIRVSGVDEAISMLLPRALIEFRKQYPDVHVQVLEISSSDKHTQELISHRTDISFIRSPTDDPFLKWSMLYRQPISVVVANSNPLAKANNILAKDILHEPIVGYPKHARPILHDLLLSSFRHTGVQPNVVCEIIDKSTLLQFVAHGLGIALVPTWVKNIAPPGLSFIPFCNGERSIELYVAQRKSGNSTVVDTFVDAAQQAADDFKGTFS